MFGKLDTHKYLFMLEMQIQNINALRIVIAEGGVAEEASELTSDELPNIELRTILKGSKPVTVTSDSAHYEIKFTNFVSYAVTYPPYTVKDDGKFDGRNGGTYTDSAFLRFVGESTYANEVYSEPLIHYCVWCFNQKIDVVSSMPPVVNEINA